MLSQPSRNRRTLHPHINLDSPQAKRLIAWFPAMGEPWGVARLYDPVGKRTAVGAASGAYVAAEPGDVRATVSNANSFAVTSDSGLNSITSGFTAALWVRATADTLWFQKHGGASNRQLQFTSATAKTSVIRAIVLDESTGGGSIGRNAPISYESAIHHLAMTWDGGTTSASIKIYKDGRQVDDTDENNASFTGMQAGTADLLLGGPVRTTDFRLYKGALTANEIWALYDPRTRWSLYQEPRSRAIWSFSANKRFFLIPS